MERGCELQDLTNMYSQEMGESICWRIPRVLAQKESCIVDKECVDIEIFSSDPGSNIPAKALISSADLL